MPARGLTTLQTVIQGLTQGAPNARVNGTGKSAPYGLEAILEYNGVYLNVLDWADTFLVKTINGLDDADIRDSRAPNPGDDGETAFNSYYGGRTMVISGKVLAGTVDRLRDMNQGLRGAFSEINKEYPLIFHGRDPERAIYINCRKNTPLQLPEEQTTPNDFLRLFNITVRASNPRFLSVVKLKRTITSAAAYIDFETVTTPVYEDFRSLIVPSGLTAGYEQIGNAYTSTGEYLVPAALTRNLLAVSNGIDNNGPSTTTWTHTASGAQSASSLLAVSDIGFAGGGIRASVRPANPLVATQATWWYPIYTFPTSVNGQVIPGNWYGFRARMRISNYEMIQNPSFETDLTGWNTLSWAGPTKQRTTNWAWASPGVASLYLVSQALGVAGQNSIPYVGGAHALTGGANIDKLAIVPGGKYEFTGKIKCINRQGTTAAAYLQVNFYDTAGNYITAGVSSTTVTSVSIQELSWLGDAPANAVACMPMIVINGGANGGLMEIYVDDVYFHPVAITGNGAQQPFHLVARWFDRFSAPLPFPVGEYDLPDATAASLASGSYATGSVIDLVGRTQAPPGAYYCGMEITTMAPQGAIHGQVVIGAMLISPIATQDADVPAWGDGFRPGWIFEGFGSGMAPSRQIFPVANWIQNPIAAVDTYGISAPAGTVTRITGQLNSFTGGATAFRRTEPNANFGATYVDVGNNNAGDSYTIYADAGKEYVFSFYGKTATPLQTPRRYRILVYWYNAAKKLVNWTETYWYETTEWQRYLAGGKAPVGTTYAQIRITWEPASGSGVLDAGEAHDFGWLMWHEGTTPKVFATAGGVAGNDPRYLPAGVLHHSETLGPIAQVNYMPDADVDYTGVLVGERWEAPRLQKANVTKVASGGPVDNGRYAELTYIGGDNPNFGFATEAPYGTAAGQGFWSTGAWMRVPPGDHEMPMVIEADWFDQYGQLVKFDSTPEFQVNDKWGWYTYEGLQAPIGAVSVRFYFIKLNPVNGDRLHVDKVLCSDSAKAGEFFDGNSDWGEWLYTGTPDDIDASRRYFYSMWKTQRAYQDAQQTVKLAMPQLTNIITNYLPNPSFEVDTAGWFTYLGPINAGTGSIARVAGSAYLSGFGLRAQRLTGGPAHIGAVFTNAMPIATAPGKVWTWSAWVNGPAGRAGTILVDWTRNGVYESIGASFTFTGAYQRVSITFRIPDGVITYTNSYVWLDNAVAGEGIDVDSAMMTPTPYLVDYFDGSTAGYSWNGTAHASSSQTSTKLDKVYDELHVVLAWVNTDNQIYAAITKTGKLGIYKRLNGVFSTLAESPAAMVLNAGGVYWLRARMAQGVVFAEWFSSSPTGTGAFGGTTAVALTSLKATLATNDVLYFENTRHPLALGIQARGAKWKVDDWRYVEITEPKGWNFYEGAGTVYVNNGKLMPFDMTPKLLTRSGLTYKVADGVLTAKITRTENPPEGQTWSMGIVGKVVDKDNYLFVRLQHFTIPSGQAGMQIGYQFGACVGGLENAWLASEATVALNAPKWLRMKTSGDVVTMEVWTTDPTLGGVASQSWVMTLGAALSPSTAQEKTLFGAGKKGEFGVKMWSPNPLTQGIEDFRLDMPSFDDIAFTVKNEGNYPAQTRIELTGPMSNPRITNEANGQSMLINTVIPAGETWVIEWIGSSKLVYRKSDSANRMQYFDDTSEWITIEPDGVPNNIRLTATGMLLGWDMDLTFQNTWM